MDARPHQSWTAMVEAAMRQAMQAARRAQRERRGGCVELQAHLRHYRDSGDPAVALDTRRRVGDERGPGAAGELVWVGPDMNMRTT